MAAGKARQYLDLGGAKNIKTQKTKKKQKKTIFSDSLEGVGSEPRLSEDCFLICFGFFAFFVFCFPKVF